MLGGYLFKKYLANVRPQKSLIPARDSSDTNLRIATPLENGENYPPFLFFFATPLLFHRV